MCEKNITNKTNGKTFKAHSIDYIVENSNLVGVQIWVFYSQFICVYWQIVSFFKEKNELYPKH